MAAKRAPTIHALLCGTPAGRLRHQKLGEKPCARCRRAHRQDMARRRRLDRRRSRR